ncbi:MAG: type I restriction enzyme HsdR N-terminal domain-containing protein [Bacteroidales bacterium]|jgi:16S rRNA G966 N2-methylase RsmD|nr:type I restriction enzyme HsdR N-terminal domain-containing protein [Bacteroidales bacterium]
MENTVKSELFGQIDFREIAENPNFKDDSVREVIILPLLHRLGYCEQNIIRSKPLQRPFLKVGTKRRPITLIPDYILKVKQNFAWVLDAKSPARKIINNAHVEQVYSYAAHPEIRSTYFALCNGFEFSLFRTSDTNQPVLYFQMEEVEKYWQILQSYLSPDSFHTGKAPVFQPVAQAHFPFDYANRPLLEEIKVKKQQAKRFFGVHGYFTKQSWNVVAEYIKNFSNTGDLVLDPFGGSGVTAVEALMNNRRTVSIDLNPMAVFMVRALIAPVKHSELTEAFNSVKNEYMKLAPHDETSVQKTLKKYACPKDVPLPKSSDVKTIEQLFSEKQMAELALLKAIILKQKNENIKQSLLLAFSSSINKHNLTFHYTNSAGGGDSGVFRYYRYRIAPHPGEMSLIRIFETKYKNVLAAKKEMEYRINEQTVSNAQIRKGSATCLTFLKKESVDYIYTDPPYGNKIPYLDLSVMWNAWLNLDVTENDYRQEAIEGGEHGKSKEEYNALIAQSIKEMYRVLKFDRWLSFVFAHKDPEFWHLIIDTAERCGFEYAGATPQKNGQTSFKKRQNPFTVLSGQLIINFRKVRHPKVIMKANLGMDISEIVMQTVEGVIAKNHGATLEQINDELIIKGLELGFLDLLKKEYSDLTPILLNRFDYNEETETFGIRKNTQFKTHIDVRLRIKYYLISYLRRMEREHKTPHADEIVLTLLPLLRNGVTPENRTVLSVLEHVGERAGDGGWRLRQTGQLSLNLFER